MAKIRIIDGLFLIVVLAWSFIVVANASIKYYKSQRSGYAPLINKANTLPISNSNYGTATNASSVNDDTASDDTVTLDIEIKSSRWTIFNLSRVLFSIAQLGLFLYAIQKIGEHKYDFSKNEGNKFDVLVAYSTHAAFWVSSFCKYLCLNGGT